MKQQPKQAKRTVNRLAALALSVCLLFTVFATSVSASGEDGKWYTDFGSYEEEQEFAAALNVELMAESMVLLKNANNALPLSNSETNITLFGARAYEIFTGGTGSGGGASDPITLVESLQQAGFNVNTRVQTIYENNKYTAAVAPAGMGGGGTITVDPPVSWLAPAESSYQFFNDAAIIVLGRTAGEGNDIYTSNVPTHSDPTDHVQSLDDNEKALIQYVKAQGFDKIIVLINSANAFECTPMEEEKTAENLGVDAIVWIGQPGNSGLLAVGKALNGEVNPSGRLVDVYPANFKIDPTWQNAHTMTQVGEKDNSVYNSASAEEPDASNGNVVEYEEGIYLGYKYYETRYADWKRGTVDEMFTDMEKAVFGNAISASMTAEEWYDMAVLYPFGYGLSYTTFEQEILTTGSELAAAINGKSALDDMVELKVRVTNTGDVAGKQVVQLYVTAPYTPGEIEKSAVSLVSFSKTEKLAPGESEVLTLRVRLGEIASFDYNDANNNGYKGWEIEAGSYTFSLRTNSHDVSDSITGTLTEKKESLDNDDDATNNTPLSNGDEYDTLINIKEYNGEAASDSQMKQMNRAEGFVASFPTPATQAERVYSEALIKLLAMTFEEQTAGTSQDESRFTTYYNSDNDKTTDPWYKTNEDIPETWTQAVANADGTVSGREDGKAPIQLVDMVGLDYWSTEVIPENHPVEEFRGKTEAEAWDLFVNQLTWEEMASSLHHGGFISPGYEALGKDQADDVNGPATVNASRTTDRADGTFWVCETNVASTWNTDLAYQQGVMFGNESLYLDCPGWYANGLNTHRSPFSGRNFEYYSQDGYQGGIIGSAVVAGVQSKGMYAFIKHYGLNDQETDRHGIGTFASEQAIREIYFKQFEYAVKGLYDGKEDSKAKAMMTGFNRVGAMSCQVNYAVQYTILREEWGFHGEGLTDAYRNTLGKLNMIQRVGCDLPLSFSVQGGDNSIAGTWDASLRDGKGGVVDGSYDASKGGSPTQYYTVRMSVTRILWVGSVSNCNENGLNKDLFADQTVNATTGLAVSASIAVDPEAYGTKDIKYSAENLPKGLTINADTGMITGSFAKDGEYTCEVTLTADGWSKKTANITFVVEPLVTITGWPENAATGTEINADVVINAQLSEAVTEDDEVGTTGLTAVDVVISNLPDGLSYDPETGKITGTLRAYDDCELELDVTTTVSTVVSGRRGNSVSRSTINYKQTIEMLVDAPVVGGNVQQEVEQPGDEQPDVTPADPAQESELPIDMIGLVIACVALAGVILVTVTGKGKKN